MPLSEYALVLLLSVLPTILLTFHPKSDMRGKVGSGICAISITAIVFILWDIWAVENNLWDFNKDFVSSVVIGNLPLEEVLFFVCIPYSSLYVWNVIRDFTTFEDLINRIQNK